MNIVGLSLILILLSSSELTLSKFIERDSSWIPKLSKNDLHEYILVSRIPLTSLFRFNFYRDVSILFYSIPEDTERAEFTFKAHEDKISTLGGNCDPQDIDIHLKSGGFPVVSPQNISFPEDFIDNELRNFISSLKILSDRSNNSIVIENPVPGDWFGLAFVSWTDPQSDKIEQQGIATVCDTVLYTDLRVKRVNVTVLASNVNVDVILRNTTVRIRDFFKFYIDQEVDYYKLNLSVISLCDFCERAIISIQARSLPDVNNNLISCSIDLNRDVSENFAINFESYPKQWHYLEVSYGDDTSLLKLPSCNKTTIEDDSIAIYNEKNHIYDLVRDTKSEYFTFEYNLPPHATDYSPSLLNITSDSISNLKFKVFPVQDIGGTLTIGASLKLDLKYYLGYRREKNNASEYYFSENDQFKRLVACIGQNKRLIPLSNGMCEFNGKQTPASINVNNTDAASSSNMVNIPYPEVGNWYVTFGLFCDGHTVCPCPITTDKNNSKYVVKSGKENNPADEVWIGSFSCNTSVIFSISSSPCIEGKCGRNGVCNYYMSGGFIYSTCRCRSGYAGWDCSDASNVPSANEVLLSTLLLTLSNLLFIPAIYFAFRRGYYTEAVVYSFTMFFSTFYHACDVSDPHYSFCIVRMGVLQYCDFFCGLLSFWVTLVAMAALNNRNISLLHMFGAIMIAFGTELNKQALLVFLIPVVVGVCIVIIAWGFRCRQTKKMFPAKAYLVLYLPVGLVLAAIGLICFAFLQTNSNYHIIHSIWHMVIALSILCFLPNKDIFFPKS